MFKSSGELPVDRHRDSHLPIPKSHEREVEVALERAHVRRGALVWIGEVGMGKSNLLARAMERLSASGARVISVPTRNFTRGGSETVALEFLFYQLAALAGGTSDFSLDVSDLLKSASARPTPEKLAQLSREFGKQIEVTSRSSSLVFVADGLELVDEITREVLVGAIAQRYAPAVILLTASDQNAVRALPYEVERRVLTPVTNTDALALLRESLDTPIAPHIARELNQHVQGAPHALLETAKTLSSAQLAGLSQLPNPLPACYSTHRVVNRYLVGVPPEERDVLLTVALCVIQRTDFILAAINQNIDSLLMSSVARFLQISAGQISIADPRVRAVVYADATVAERAAVHAKLADVHAEGGSRVSALWHRSQASLEGDEALSKELVIVARRMLSLGSADWAQRVAREAISHATGKQRPRAMAIAGQAALHAGNISDALGLLREAVRLLPKEEARNIYPALTAAITLSTGQVPDEAAPDASSHSRTQTLTAIFQLERGRRAAGAQILARMEKNSHEIEPDKIALLRAWSHTLAGEFEAGIEILPTRFSEAVTLVGSRVAAALALTGTGSVTEAHREISSAISELSATTISPWETEFHEESFTTLSATPILASYLHLADILVEYASGNLAGAQKTLEQAAFSLPMTLPAAGLICVIAGRVSVLKDGKLSELAIFLEELLPKPLAPLIHTELVANRALAHLISGEIREAETLLEMTSRTRFRTLPLIVRPNHLDIAALLAQQDAPSETSASLPSPLDRATSRSEKARKTSGPGDADRTSNAISAAVRESEEQSVNTLHIALLHLLSGRRSFDLATASGTGDVALNSARNSGVESEQLLRAGMLLAELGAHALADLAQTWARAGLPQAPAVPNKTEKAGGGSFTAAANAASEVNDNPHATLPVWAAPLTPREREVAQIIASGSSNREAAAHLFVSVRTIEVHLTSIFRKLEIGSRVELAIVVNQAPKL